MIGPSAFLDAALDQGFDFYTGVPCSFLTPLINAAINHPRLSYVGATSEGEAVALAAGAWLAGHTPVVLAQNSGLGNMVNPLTSLCHPFRIPVLLLCTWRGKPGLRDEPQHEVMGQVMHDLLTTIRVRHRPFPDQAHLVRPALDEVRHLLATAELPVALVVERGAVSAGQPLDPPAPQPPTTSGRLADHCRGRDRPARVHVLASVTDLVPPDVAVLASTGKCGRELFTLGDREQFFYQVGSMGCASALGLGIALNTRRRVVVLDGDGAALMKLGNLATIGACRPDNLIHVVLDNQAHDSTGGQRTVSGTVSFGQVALACGYRGAAVCDEVDGFAEAFQDALTRPGPHLLHTRIAVGSLDRLGRPTTAPHEVARRFRRFVTSG
ncbi:phosphonopyruvate decarboxylase [Goodfellowiella coeruleoviolacea]|uniref:Phosphonopyruvate decarboxylase n=1 Tax=Goodfellowiella coeruleoviolacea TaxID=334858 RepID=A0AAE3KDP4_9PSEU|nr:phosphonopyruvate decarboxylase [Goodfellowiella coeruleoviolacea]MCP2164301.1 phosphonopyruvate decarboxylase (EC 4.1.1.82) [Goodfellowiella coeruleoviolacea]